MSGRGIKSLAVFGALSVSVHAGVFAALQPSRTIEGRFAGDQPAGIIGDTLDVERPPIAATEDVSTHPVEAVRSAARTAMARPSANTPHAAAADVTRAPDGPQAQSALFGAVGVRFATDLASTFTRALPQASSADPAWADAPFGAAGWADVTLVLEPTGHLASRTASGSPSSALRSSIERTLALLGDRVFTARQPVTHLRVTAQVTRDDRHDGMHGDVFALSGGSFVGDVGNAFFALPVEGGVGRRVDAQVRSLR